MKWGNKALIRFQGFSFRKRSESFCERPHLKQSNWHSDAPRRFPHERSLQWRAKYVSDRNERHFHGDRAGRCFSSIAKSLVPSGGTNQHCICLECLRANGKAVSQQRSQVFGPDRTLHYSPFCFFAAKWVQTEKRNPLPTSYQVSPQLTHAQSIFMIIIVVSSPAWFFPFSSSYGPVESQGDGVRVYHPHTPFTPPPMQTQESSASVTPGILLTPDSHTF